MICPNCAHESSADDRFCGSCGVRINGSPTLACNTKLSDAVLTSSDGVTIEVEPMGNMPVIRDLIDAGEKADAKETSSS